MINPKLNINKAFREQLNKCMNTKFGEITQPNISKTLAKKIRVLALLMFYETRKILSIFQSVELCCLYNYLELCLH